MPTSVALSSHFESFVNEQVSTGRFNNVSEVVRAGLRLLEDQEEMKAIRLQELRMAIHAGVSSGAGVDAEQVFERLERKYQDAVSKATARAGECQASFRLLRTPMLKPSVTTSHSIALATPCASSKACEISAAG